MRQLLGKWEARADHRNVVNVVEVRTHYQSGPEVAVFDNGSDAPLSLLEAWFRRVDGDPDAEVIAG